MVQNGAGRALLAPCARPAHRHPPGWLSAAGLCGGWRLAAPAGAAAPPAAPPGQQRPPPLAQPAPRQRQRRRAGAGAARRLPRPPCAASGALQLRLAACGRRAQQRGVEQLGHTQHGSCARTCGHASQMQRPRIKQARLRLPRPPLGNTGQARRPQLAAHLLGGGVLPLPALLSASGRMPASRWLSAQRSSLT
jgi:hypothetical protein